MNFLKQIRFPVLLTLCVQTNSLIAQEYLLFKKQKGFNDILVSENIRMYQNHIQASSSDTVVDFYNFYCTSNPSVIPANIDQMKPQLNAYEINTDLLITAVVGYKRNTQSTLKKISKEEFATYKMLTGDKFVETFFKMANSQMTSRNVGMQENRTLRYKLIIEDNGTYYLVNQSVPVLVYFISDNLWYYPNEFKPGVLNASYRFTKLYTQSDFQKIDKETGYSGKIRKQLDDRTYPSEVDTQQNVFKLPVFSYWELLNEEANFMIGNNLYKTHTPGLGTFSLLPKVGIVCASFKPSLSQNSMPSDMSGLKIQSVNGESPEVFAGFLKKNLYPKMIIGDQ